MVATSLEDAFIKVSFEEEGGDSKAYAAWLEKASAKFSKPNLQAADLLRKQYPGHSLVMSQDFRLNVLNFPQAICIPLKPDELLVNTGFFDLGRGADGVLVGNVEYGCFRVAWESNEYTMYIMRYVEGLGSYTQQFLLHEGPDEHSRRLLLNAGAWANQLHNEIWVFNQGFWQKDAGLWTEVQKANWDDVILDEAFKRSLQKDVYSFFDSEDLYKKLGIPWKRGMIMRGPPGNGKTISLKAIMKTIQERGFNPLYVKSFQSFMGEEGSMDIVFSKARLLSPCVIILEDLDSLINDRNRSYFLNQLDGIEGNDGLMLIGTTNHFDRLDPGLSTRPSRFDRIYFFDNPSRAERVQYARYWQSKLKDNKDVPFPDSLLEEIAGLTEGFSFAYLKEAFVSSLVLLASDDNNASFDDVLKDQIKTLRKQLDKSPSDLFSLKSADFVGATPLPPKPDSMTAMRGMVEQTIKASGRAASTGSAVDIHLLSF